jgi:hypothetical protein
LILRERYEDYELMTFRYKRVQYSLLPNPFNRGDDWYKEVYGLLRKKEFREWSPGVRAFWWDRVEKLHAYERMVDDDLANRLGDWTAMVGF